MIVAAEGDKSATLFSHHFIQTSTNFKLCIATPRERCFRRRTGIAENQEVNLMN
jgi:hypothetical protein